MKETNEVVVTDIFQTTFILRDFENTPDHEHFHSLNEIQRRACRIHQRHGAIYGGYTLEDWLRTKLYFSGIEMLACGLVAFLFWMK